MNVNHHPVKQRKSASTPMGHTAAAAASPPAPQDSGGTKEMRNVKILMSVLRKLHVVQKNGVSTLMAATSAGVCSVHLATSETFGGSVEM